MEGIIRVWHPWTSLFVDIIVALKVAFPPWNNMNVHMLRIKGCDLLYYVNSLSRFRPVLNSVRARTI